MSGIYKELLLTVNCKVRMDYETYLRLIPEEQRIQINWLHRDFLPSLVLMPLASLKPDQAKGNIGTDASALAGILQLFYLAQQVHNHSPKTGTTKDYQMPILIGDYLSAIAFKHLINEEKTKWLECLSTALCRVSEANTVRSQWHDKNFVPLDKKVTNLHGEYGELAAVAGLMAADLIGFTPEQTQAYTSFCFYAGVLQGMILNAYHEEKSAYFDEYMDYCGQYIYSLPLSLGNNLSKFILDEFADFSNFVLTKPDPVGKPTANSVVS